MKCIPFHAVLNGLWLKNDWRQNHNVGEHVKWNIQFAYFLSGGLFVVVFVFSKQNFDKSHRKTTFSAYIATIIYAKPMKIYAYDYEPWGREEKMKNVTTFLVPHVCDIQPKSTKFLAIEAVIYDFVNIC